MTGAAVEAQKMSVVRFEINAGVPEGYSAVVVLRGVVDEAFRYGPRIVPDGSASASVERIGIVRCSYKHDAPGDDWRYFQIAHVARVEDPLRFQLADVGGRNFRQAAEAPPGIISVIGEPIFTRGLGSQIGGLDVDRCGDCAIHAFLRRC